MEIRKYDGSEESERDLKTWMVDSASAPGGNYHHVGGDGSLVVHPGDSVYRMSSGGFGVLCDHKRWNALPYNVVWQSRNVS